MSMLVVLPGFARQSRTGRVVSHDLPGQWPGAGRRPGLRRDLYFPALTSIFLADAFFSAVFRAMETVRMPSR